MIRFSPAILAAVLAAAPIPTFAQSWPVSGTASAPAMTDRRDGVALATARVAAWSVARRASDDHKRRIVLKTPPEASELRRTPEVELRPRAEWLYDEGLSIGAGGLAYKERF